MAGHVVKVSVVAETAKFKKAFRGLANETGLTKLADAGKTAVATLAKVGTAASIAMVGIAAKGVQMAADLEQSTGAIQDIFKDSADQMLAFSKKAATAVGLTQNEFNELATLLGSQLKNAGVPMDQLAGKTNDLIGLGADLSAMFGGTTADAVGALSSALKGERDPIEKYGVSLKQAAIDAKAAEMGFQKVGGSFDQEAQAAATLALIMEQTSDAHGKFAREGDTLAHKVQVLRAQLLNIWTTLGTYLLPVVTRVVGWVGDNLTPALIWLAAVFDTQVKPKAIALANAFTTNVLPHLRTLATLITGTVLPAAHTLATQVSTHLGPIIRQVPTFLRDWGPAALTAIATLAAFYQGFLLLQKAKAIIELVKVAWASLQALMAANPIVLVAAAVAALVAGLVYAYQHSETFRTTVQAAWTQIQAAAQAAADWFTTNAMPVLVAAWQSIQNGAQVVSQWFTDTLLPTLLGVWSALSEYASAAWTWIKAAWDTIGYPVAHLILSVFQGVAANWGTIWSGIQSVVSGVWQIISTVITTALAVIRGVITAATAVMRGDWAGAWNAIKGVAAAVWDGIKGIVSGAISIVRGIVTGGIGIIRGVWSGAWNSISSTVSGAWSSISSAVSNGVSSALSRIRSLPSQAVSALSGLGSTLWNAGSSLIQGFINGITSKISSVKATLGDLTSSLTSWKGPESLDKVLLTPAGQFIIEGLIRGLESRYQGVRRSLTGLTHDIQSTDLGSLTAPTITTPNAPTQTGGQVVFSPTIVVHSLVPTPETGRAVMEAMEAWWAVNGRRSGMGVMA